MRHDRHFVDELTQRMGEGVGRMVAIDDIALNPAQPRSDVGDLEDLVSSISKHGVLEPLLVRRTEDGRSLQLVSGERRFRAAREAGLHEVPCIELELGDEEALEIALIENLQRKDLNPFEEAEGFKALIESHGYTHEQVAEAVGRSRVTVTEALRVLEIPDEIRELCRHADITAKGILLEIARVKDLGAMRRLVDAIVRGALDRDEIRRLRRELEGAGSGDDAAEATPGDSDVATSRRRPFVIRFRHPERAFSIALSFKTEKEPDAEEVIAALEQMIRELRQDVAEESDA
jgi:ParB family chromosome partitioning protein